MENNKEISFHKLVEYMIFEGFETEEFEVLQKVASLLNHSKSSETAIIKTVDYLLGVNLPDSKKRKGKNDKGTNKNMEKSVATDKITKARDLILECGSIDGGHHKMWVLDQALRVLCEDKYDQTVKEWECDGAYKWDIGIAP